MPPTSRLIVAAGGGGGGAEGEASAGAAGGAAGSDGSDTTTGNPGGKAGTATEGGAGGLGFFGTGGTGQLGLGGVGGASGFSGGTGGGGGGGYYGGGGGGGGEISGGGGGGGGSSLIPPSGSKILTATPPQVEITYTLVPPSIAIVSPASGATYNQGQAVTASYSCTPPAGTTVEFCEGPVANGAALDTSTLGPHAFKVEAEDKDGAAATKEVTWTRVVAPPTPTPDAAPISPDTILGSHPKEIIKTKKKKVKVKFRFSSNVTGASFKCKLDKGAFAPCTSPKSYKVKLGRHTFSVEAVSAGGTDPAPESFSFKVKKKT